MDVQAKDGAEPLQIISITATNIKKMKAMYLEPGGPGVLVITGRNGQGKTSATECFWLAIGGREASKNVDKIIRDGEGSAEVILDLGRLIVHRRWRYDKNDDVVSTLELRAADGAKYDKPQSVLDTLFELVALDPEAFARMDEKEQVAELIRAIGETERLEELDAEREEYFTARTDKTRDAKAKLAAANELPEYGDEVPDSEYSTTEIVDYINKGLQAAADYKALMAEPDKARTAITEVEREIFTVEDAIAKQRNALADAEGALDLKKSAHIKRQDELVAAEEAAAAATKPPDIDELKQKGEKLDELNGKVRKKINRRELLLEADALDDEATELTSKIYDVDERKAKIIADAELPVQGLSFTEDGVTHDGIPVNDCAESDKLKIGVAIAMALNPTLRVIRITNGSALDSANMQWLREIAIDEKFLVIVERVEDDSDGVIVIEDGEIVGAGEVAA